MTTTDTRFFYLSPTSPAHRRLEEAERFFLEQNLNEALAAAQQAWREFPTEPDVFRVLAYIHMARGEYPPAAQAAYQSVVVDGENPASYATLAQVYITFNLLANAEQTLDAAQQRFAEDTALLVLNADLKFRLRKHLAALQLAQRVLLLNPQDGYANALVGTHFLQKKRYREVLEPLRIAVQAYPQRWDYARDLGIALLHGGRVVEARAQLARSFRLNPADPATRQHLYYAAQLGAGHAGYWSASFFFYNHSALGWILNIVGIVAAAIGFFWELANLSSLDSVQAIGITGLLLAGGMALVVMTWRGITLRSKKGRKFELFLRKAATEEAECQTSSDTAQG